MSTNYITDSKGNIKGKKVNNEYHIYKDRINTDI